MPVVVVISQHLLNVFVQLANKRGFKKKYIRYNLLNVLVQVANKMELKKQLYIWVTSVSTRTSQKISFLCCVCSNCWVDRFFIV
jgi:hypothetical protein